MPSKKGKKERIENKSKEKYLLQSYQGGFLKVSGVLPCWNFHPQKIPPSPFSLQKNPSPQIPPR